MQLCNKLQNEKDGDKRRHFLLSYFRDGQDDSVLHDDEKHFAQSVVVMKILTYSIREGHI